MKRSGQYALPHCLVVLTLFLTGCGGIHSGSVATCPVADSGKGRATSAARCDQAAPFRAPKLEPPTILPCRATDTPALELFGQSPELAVEALVDQVLTRNPS